jgi:ABC-type transporter Mla maintaining outer membrane lipid asymmetry ATPase subunit MlaF
VTADPIVVLTGVSRHTGDPEPLRVRHLAITRGMRLVLSGLDAGAAEVFVNLITGAALPDEGDVRVWGRSTREIATDTEWLTSLDALGIVTARAVLIDQLPIVSNLALPLTLAIEPLAPELRARLEAIAGEVGLPRARLDDRAVTLTPAERLRLHLARAIAPAPSLLLLEHPTTGLEPAAAAALGATLRQVSAARNLTWIAISDNTAFARASGGTRRRLVHETGAVERVRAWPW